MGMRNYVVSQNCEDAKTLEDFAAALSWGKVHLSGDWTIRTMVDGKCVIERTFRT